MGTQEHQRLFFKHIRSVIAPNLSFVDDIAETLSISNDSAYRRIRGEKEITFDEIHKLCKRYRISLDQIMHVDSDSTVFHGRNLDTEHFDFENYLREILTNLKQINSATTRKMYYEAKDIPIFHHFQFPELATFKYFFWMKSVMNYPSYSKMHFEDNQLRDAFQKMGKEIISTYSKIPSVEIWVVESINATIRQIAYYHDAGIFRSKDTIALLFTQLENLVEHIREQAEHGEKFVVGEKPTGQAGNYELYCNEVFLGHNTIVVEADGLQTTYINHAVMNFMATRDADFCHYTKRSFENNMKKSVLISSVSEKERSRFFNILISNITSSRKGILG
jgi:hypothetical protein